MTNYRVYQEDGDSAHGELNSNPDITVGDTIEYFTSNQEGYKKYEVILENNVKGLKLIQDYYGNKTGGKRRRRTHKKRSSHKKRRTAKRRRSYKK